MMNWSTSISFGLVLVTTAVTFGATTVSFKTDSAIAREEGLVPASVVVTRSSTAGELRIPYAVAGMTIFDIKAPFSPYKLPFLGKDFEPLPGSVTFLDGVKEAEITVRPMTHYHFRSQRRDRNVEITLQPGDGYSLGQKKTAIVTIKDDPSPKTLPSDEIFFSKLDLSMRALAEVATAVGRKNYPAARTALAAYYRERKTPTLGGGTPSLNRTTADRALKGTYSVSGVTHTFNPTKIDWSGLDVKDPNSGKLNPNWGWEFNRFAWWPSLVGIYLQDPVANKAYGERIAYELRDWIDTSPLELEVQGLKPGVRWRALEVATRLGGSWMRAFQWIKNTPLIDDELLIDWMKSFYMHARYLEVSAELTTNRGAGEAYALLAAGVLLPEFKEAGDWRKLGLIRLENIIRTDVLPDGVYNELSPGYLDFTLPNFENALNLASSSGIETPESFRTGIMKMFDYLLYASEPNRYVPSLNDSQKLYKPLDVRLRIAAKLFPERQDYAWFTTDGKTGTPPPQTSRLFADAGQAVMRSGWGRQDNYLLMDAGPFGVGGHGNEDKLSINVDGYGVRHIIDCGPYDYVDTSPYRIYSISTLGKSAPFIDNLSQNRKGVRALGTRPSPVLWRTSDQYDYASGIFGVDPDEGWGPKRVRPAETRRHVIFLKPDVWVVVDAFKALDEKAHTYGANFQCSDDVVETDASNRVTIQLKPGEFDPENRVPTKVVQPSMTITPVSVKGQTLRILKGEEPPEIAGWKFEKSTSWKKQAIPTARFEVKATGDVQLAYVLTAAPSDAAVRKPTAEPITTEPGTFGIRLKTDASAPERTVLIALDGKRLTWEGKAYDVPCLILEKGVVQRWPD